MIARAASGLVLCVLVWAAAPPLQAQEANRILPQLRLSHYPERSPSIPSDFTYGGKPIEAVCIEKLVGDESRSPSLQSCPRPVNILDCLLSENHDNDAWWDLRGYRGYCHMATEEGPGGSYSVQHNIIYKYLGKLEGHHAVLAEWGTGTSSSSVERAVMLVDIQGNPPVLVLVKTFSKASLVPIDARIQGSKLLYTAAAQGFQLAELSGANLSAAGVSAADFPESQTLADTDIVEFENGLLERVWLIPHAHTIENAQPRQKCFDRNHQHYLDTKRIVLSAVALRKFIQEVIACMKAAG